MTVQAATHSQADVAALAAEMLACLDRGGQMATFSSRIAGFDPDMAHRVAAAMRDLRVARGEKIVGRKVGFTNRTIWPEYGVYAPNWGYVYDRTVRDLSETGGEFPLAGLAEPRIEPEIIFGMAAAPAADLDDRALLSCVAWVAHGFELVHSPFPGWKFAPADTAAANALHGALLIGPRHPVKGREDEWQRTLATFEIDLKRNDAVADHGRAANVLDGPLSAVSHLVGLLRSDPHNPKLAAGEIVSTGTLTRALPVAAGETWSTEFSGIALDGIRVTFV